MDGPGSSYLHGSRQLHTPVVLQVGSSRHQGKAVLVVHPCELPGVLGQPCRELQGWGEQGLVMGWGPPPHPPAPRCLDTLCC